MPTAEETVQVWRLNTPDGAMYFRTYDDAETYRAIEELWRRRIVEVALPRAEYEALEWFDDR